MTLHCMYTFSCSTSFHVRLFCLLFYIIQNVNHNSLYLWVKNVIVHTLIWTSASNTNIWCLIYTVLRSIRICRLDSIGNHQRCLCSSNNLVPKYHVSDFIKNVMGFYKKNRHAIKYLKSPITKPTTHSKDLPLPK